MKIKTFLSIAVILFVSGGLTDGQTYSRIFGDIAPAEIQMKTYPKSPKAEAVVLYDMGRSYFTDTDNSFNVIFEKTTRIKVLNPAGISWADIEILFYREGDIYEKVYDIEAYTYNYEDDKLIKSSLNPSNIYDETINQYWNSKKFAMPDVKPGSIIEYRYKISSPYQFNLRDWEFQWRIPVHYSEYVVRMIPYYDYTYLLQGASKFDVFESSKDQSYVRPRTAPGVYTNNTIYDMVYKFAMNEVPAFVADDFITSPNDYIIKIDFQLSKINHPNGSTVSVISTWSELVKELLAHRDFGKYVNSAEGIAAKQFDVKAVSRMEPMDRLNYVMNHVKYNFKWNNLNSRYASKSPSSIANDKTGNCADLNLLATGFLNSVGITAYPVLLSTRENGKIKSNYPFLHFFNYVVILAEINGNTILTDATQPLGRNDRIPARCLNDQGLVIRKGDVYWVGLGFDQLSEIDMDFRFSFPSPERVSTKVTLSATEYDALSYRKSYGNDPELVAKDLNNDLYTVAQSSITIDNFDKSDDPSSPYTVSYTAEGRVESIGDKIYIRPFLAEIFSENPFRQETRDYPVDLTYPVRRHYKSLIPVPDGYKIEVLPDKIDVDNNYITMKYLAVSDEKGITVELLYEFKKAVYGSRDYSFIKFYFGEIAKKGNERIVLVRTTPEKN